ncbi:nuclear transport factor 2 family protein [Pedobacter frigidisoli]|uniref:Nuclear transport factor 2 family protein n=1 Tax=Pedobacter frigidisoli TaxID=2530455 RepID=A0A4R0P3Y8_9SPHI|nr:nuclear transport factor 2 family protein [Pedobacter frigidisoli]TCD10338.1 nuclear transport factor 2 family protein [Pedobacter frigidisoli]
MDLSKLTNTKVKGAFEAWQSGDSAKWLSLFTPDAKLYDDGNPRDFHQFSTQTIGKEKFTSIDHVSTDGYEITGNFHSPQWGDFKTYFKFNGDDNGKFNRLDIGQAN